MKTSAKGKKSLPAGRSTTFTKTGSTGKTSASKSSTHPGYDEEEETTED